MPYSTHKLPILTLLFSIIFLSGNAQICTGNLGENIFEAGDFGSGAANVVGVDPMIAPGFHYNTLPPPPDGDYTLTNNTGLWGSIFPTWLRIMDNSEDPFGYMMVVNASYQPGLFYEQVIDGLCGNTLYVFSADIINLIKTGNNYIKPNVSFLLDGVEAFTTGDVPEDEKWHTYGFTFTTGSGQSTLTLSLRNNAPGGIGNDIALDNITFRPCGPEAWILPTTIANICEDGEPIALEATIAGDQFPNPAVQWQQSPDGGVTWENINGATDLTYLHTALSGGFYYYRFLLANDVDNLLNSKCRIISNTKIVHVVPKFYSIIDTLCEGLFYELGNNQYETTGVFTDSFISSLGCDSIVTLDLTIVPKPEMMSRVTINEPTCADTKDGMITIGEVTNGQPPYSFYLNDSILPLDDIFSNLIKGDYTLSITDRYGCISEQDILLPGPAPFIIDLGPDLTTELGNQISLNVTHSEALANFHWIPSELNDCEDDCLSPQWFPPATTTVYFSASTENGCLAVDSLIIHIIKNRRVYIPNVFSPNDDGINDYFTIFGSGPNIQQIKSIQIFNRWGDLVFNQKNFPPNELSSGWDGSFNGRAAAPGLYTYATEIQFLDNKTIQYAGDVLLIR